MILTITMNPSVDISYKLDTLLIDGVNRVSSISKTAGGKGLNVARVLSILKEPVLATGLLGGSVGDYIAKQLSAQNIEDKFMIIQEESRNCIAVIHDNGKQTEILESGPAISDEQRELFLEHLETILEGVNVATISGSLPKGLPENYYVHIIEMCNRKNIKVILDTSGNQLKTVLNSKAKPFAIKPNIDEITDISTVYSSLSETELISIIKSDLFEGITCVMVSDGSKGAYIKWANELYKAIIPKVNSVNPVGSGDATVAGLAKAVRHSLTVEDTIKTAMTTGVLNAMSDKTGFIEMKEYNSIFKDILLKKID